MDSKETCRGERSPNTSREACVIVTAVLSEACEYEALPEVWLLDEKSLKDFVLVRKKHEMV